jgi:hypothetical protein
VDDKLHTFVTDSLPILLLRLQSPIDIELFNVWQLHDKRCQLRHLFQCVENCLKAVDSVGIVSVFYSAYSIAKAHFCELSHFA